MAIACGSVRALTLALALVALPALGQTNTTERVAVTDPYLDMRTGPGRGYPVTFVVARGEWIEVLLRQTDWFKVRIDGGRDAGRQGWVHRTQLQATLSAAAAEVSWRDMVLVNALQRRLELGAAWGRFNSETMLKLWSGYRVSDAFSFEGTIGQLHGAFTGTEFWQVNLNAQPWSDRRWSPLFAIGVGRFRNLPISSAANAATTNANLLDASIGLRYYLSPRYVARTDFTIYTAFSGNNRISEYRAVTIGLSFDF